MKPTYKTTLRSAVAVSLLGLAGGLMTSAAFAADYPAPGDFANGSKVWAENCGRCHRIRGAKELRDDQWITTVFHMRVRAGLTGQETRDVLTFLQASNNTVSKTATETGKPGKVSASSAPTPGLTGKTIFEQTCVACHGADGTGTLPGVPDFTRKDGRLSRSDDVLLGHIANGFQSPGSPMAMPPRGGNASLTDGDLRNVLKYLRDTFGS